jgi:hypothetical protein
MSVTRRTSAASIALSRVLVDDGFMAIDISLVNLARKRHKKLNVKRLEAIVEALTARLAGCIDHDTPTRDAYEGALEWANEILQRRTITPRKKRRMTR